MKKFSKLVAVVLAIAVIICPMMSVVSHATTTGGYKIEAIDANNLKLTINSTDGFIAYHATVGFNSNTAFQSSYNADNYTNGLKVISYTLKTAEANDHNKPAISANASGNSLTVIVMPSDINNLDKCTEIVIGIRVADGTTASLTKIQAADNGADVTADPTLLSFPAAGSDGVIDSTAQDYIASNATTSAHTHAFTQQSTEATNLKDPATCTADATYWYSCATCGLASSTEYFTATGTKIAHTPDHTKTFAKDPATCTTDATYYDECSVCHQQLDTFWTENNTALGHNMTFHAATSSTCKVQGNIEYYTCSRCNKFFADENGATELTEEGTKRALAAHTPRAAVVENNVPATCTTAGSYDSVVYCAVCGDEISRNHVDVQTTAHTPGEPVIENSVASTCTEGGHYDTVVYCTECGAEISRETTNLEPNGHTVVNDAAVAATCTATGLTAGTHCSVCGAVITAQTVVPALGHAYTYHANGDGTHTVGCERCDYSVQDACDTEGTDGACSKCGYKAQAVCTHNYVGVVTTQPTKTSTGVMTYTCTECGDSYTEDIAIPTLNNTVTFKHTLNVSAVGSDEITVSTKQMRTAYGDGATYFIDVNYQKYSSYNVVDINKVLTAADRTASLSTANKDTLYFKDMALYEMTLSFDMTIYFKNEAGVVVGYKTFASSIADMAVDLALTASDTLKTALADMCNYGATAQTYFATANPGTDICSATLPTVVFADYMTYASDVSILPEAGEYDNTKQTTQKIVNPTGFISAGMTLNVGASNRIEYTVRYDDYDAADCQIVMTYTSIYGPSEFDVDMSELIANGVTGAGKPKFIYYFGDLAIYDVNAVVTMNMYHNGVLEAQSHYSVGNFVNTYFNDTNLGPVMKAMELFANSTAIALGQGSIF